MMFTPEMLQIGDLNSRQMAVVCENILSMSVEYTMDQVMQISFKIIDPGLEWAKNGYFRAGRDVVYATTGLEKQRVFASEKTVYTRVRHLFEIESAGVSQEFGATPVWEIKALPKAYQQMRRMRFRGGDGVTGVGVGYVKSKAKLFGLKFVGQESGLGLGEPNSTEVKTAGTSNAYAKEDVTSVIAQVANQAKWWISDGTLYFGTEQWFLKKWGTVTVGGDVKKDKKGKVILDSKGKPVRNPVEHYIPMSYPPVKDQDSQMFRLLGMPKIELSANDLYGASGSLVVDRSNGVRLRPGMTVKLKMPVNNIPMMPKYFLISSVSFEEQSTTPVTVEIRTPELLKNQDGDFIGEKFLPIGKTTNTDPSYTSRYDNGVVSFYNISSTKNFDYVLAENQNRNMPITSNPLTDGQIGNPTLPNSRRPATIYTKQLSYYGLPSEADWKKIYTDSGLPSTFVEPDSWPIQNFIVEYSNIDLYNRPIYPALNFSKKECCSSRLSLEKIGDNYVVLERLWCNAAPYTTAGSPSILSEENALSWYLSSGYHHGIIKALTPAQITALETATNRTIGDDIVAQIYSNLLIAVQKKIIKSRYPKNWKTVWSGRTDSGSPYTTKHCGPAGG